MNNLIDSVEALKANMKQLVYDIGQEMDHKQLYMGSLDILMNISDIEYKLDAIEKSSTKVLIEQAESDLSDEEVEILKVKRKLKRWARNPDQINSRILTKFIELQNSQDQPVTEDMLRGAFGDDVTFAKNLPQMITISRKNHGKVFSKYCDVLSIWEPVKRYVEEFETAVSNNK